MGKNKKQGQRYTGPFEITERVGRLAYRLNLPAHWRIHNVINIAFLEPAVGPNLMIFCTQLSIIKTVLRNWDDIERNAHVLSGRDIW